MSSNAGPGLVRGIWAAMGIAVVIVLLRAISKYKIRNFGIDDILMFVALGLAISSTSFLTISVHNGFGKNLSTLQSEPLKNVLRCIAIQVPLLTISTAIARLSFSLYLLRILSINTVYRIALWTSMLLQLSSNIVSAVLPLSICRNVRILWDPSVHTTCGNVSDVVKFSYFSSSLNTATDFFLVVFPATVFWNLNLKLKVKISLIFLLSLGLLAMVASIIKTTALEDVPSVTNVGATGGILLIRWAYAENAIIIITSSVPAIWPLVMSSVRKISSVAKSQSYELTGPFPGTNNNKTNTLQNTVTGGSRRFGERSVTDSDRIGDADSLERILGSEEHLGIRKQVEVSVLRSDNTA
ncbi:hypothetical protein UA08_01911 [Talaromyces atroroseus]|uniref:Rhodopsin domain-containing protein n=1 Tax=Talaromyces atroroseus TaxID=1441469 RepID=A0A1Q5QB68_TALAT|nr:hypothetical protein UA08_01911 [Talaromyces atroroseus]OKL63058.1 hypothetical protein UA08_01911 [Talaromyces atroroseus]